MKDTLFNQPRDHQPFVFDEAVAAVFPDMVKRSVPGYATVIAGTGLAAGSYAQAGSNCYDLGCSTGASSFAMAQHIKHNDCKIIAVDNSEDMLAQCRANTADHQDKIEIQFLCADICEVSIENAAVVVLNYTLQFIPAAARADLLTTIYKGMNPGGVLILSEKIAFDKPSEQDTQTQLHEAFKKEQGYSDLEISQKRAALENVLIAETMDQHFQRLQDIGFKNTQQWFRCFNFASLLAWK